MATISDTFSALKQKGFRLTRVRKSILSFLHECKAPVSAQEILAELSATGFSTDKTTVYRELEFLLSNAIVREIVLADGPRRYEIVGASHHHHHLICVKCKTISCVEIEECVSTIEAWVRREQKFNVLSHSLKFYGICNACALSVTRQSPQY